MLVFENVKAILPDRVEDTCVTVDGGKIIGLDARTELPAENRIDGKGLFLSPGFVDIHTHGGGGHETMECDPTAIAAMCRAHLAHGTTTILPTLSAAPMVTTMKALEAGRKAIEGGLAPNAAGLYLEGPFMSPAQAGAQLPENLLIPAETDYQPLLDCWPGGIKMLGAAPELPGGMELGEACAARGITASIAHSDADIHCVEEAISHGYTDVTHIYSGCSTIIRRSGFRVPGIVEAGLLYDGLSVQIIADLCHLPAELLKLAVKCKGVDAVSLVTDSLLFAGTELEEGKSYFQTNGQECIYEDGVMKMSDRKAFCGSVATADRLVRNMRSIGFSWPEVLTMAAATPARVTHLQGKGRIALGFDADLLLFDEDVNLQGIWLKGEKVQ